MIFSRWKSTFVSSILKIETLGKKIDSGRSVKNLCFKKLNMQAIKIPRLNNDMPYFMKKCLTIINFILRTS